MYTIAKFVNFTLKNKINLIFVFSCIISVISFLSKSVCMFFILETIIFILGMTTIRVSDVLVYNKILHIFSMSLKDVNMYSLYNYQTERDKISELFKEEFIKGILNIPSNYMKC